MKRPHRMSLPAKYFAVQLAITAAYLVAAVVIADAFDLVPVLALVAAGVIVGWQLRDAFTEWNSHRRLERLRAERAAAADAAVGQLAEAIRGVTPEQVAAFRRRIGLPETTPTEETRP